MKNNDTLFLLFQGSWEKRILKSLNSMCTELSIPLARKVHKPFSAEVFYCELTSEKCHKVG